MYRALLGSATVVALPDGLVDPQDLALKSALVAQPEATAVLAGLLDVLAVDARLLDTIVGSALAARGIRAAGEG